MPKIKGNEISQQAINEALRCDTVDALLEVAEKHGIDLTREEAEVFLEEMDDIDLDHKVLAMVAGGKNW